MVAGCPESEDGEHYGIDGKLIKFSINYPQVVAHYLGYCEFCGCPIHFTFNYYQSEDCNGDTLEETRIDGAKEIYIDE